MALNTKNPKNQPSTDAELLDLGRESLLRITDETANTATYARLLTMLETECEEDRQAALILAADVLFRIEAVFASLQQVRSELKTPDQLDVHHERAVAA